MTDRKLTAERRAALLGLLHAKVLRVAAVRQTLLDALSDLDAADGEIGSLRGQLAVESASVWDVKGRYRADMDHSDAMLADRQATIQRQADEIAGLRAERDDAADSLAAHLAVSEKSIAEMHGHLRSAWDERTAVRAEIASLRKLCGEAAAMGEKGWPASEGAYDGQHGPFWRTSAMGEDMYRKLRSASQGKADE